MGSGRTYTVYSLDMKFATLDVRLGLRKFQLAFKAFIDHITASEVLQNIILYPYSAVLIVTARHFAVES